MSGWDSTRGKCHMRESPPAFVVHKPQQNCFKKDMFFFFLKEEGHVYLLTLILGELLFPSFMLLGILNFQNVLQTFTSYNMKSVFLDIK